MLGSHPITWPLLKGLTQFTPLKEGVICPQILVNLRKERERKEDRKPCVTSVTTILRDMYELLMKEISVLRVTKLR